MSVSGSSMMKIGWTKAIGPKARAVAWATAATITMAIPASHTRRLHQVGDQGDVHGPFQRHLRGRLALQDRRDGVARRGEQGEDDAEQLVDGYVDVHLVHAHVEGSCCTLTAGPPDCRP